MSFPSQNLLNYWKFDEESGTSASDEVGSDTFTLSGNNISFGASGKLSRGLYFDGSSSNDHAELPAGWVSSDLNIATINFWAYITSSGSRQIFNSCKSGNAHFQIRCDSGKFAVHMGGFGGGLGMSFSDTTTLSSFLNTWLMITAVWSKGVSVGLYINGSPRSTNIDYGTLSLANFPVNPTNKTYIGRDTRHDYDSQTMKGYVDELGVWGKVLSSQEITDLYNSGNGLGYSVAGSKFTTVNGVKQTSGGVIQTS